MHNILAARSNFSIGQSILTVERLIDEAKAVGAGAVALTDDMTVTGMIDFTKRAQKAGVKPIIGCRLRLTDDVAWRKTKESKKAPRDWFVTWYARTEKGLQALYRLLTLAHSEERFYMVPKLGFDDFFAALDSVTGDDVIIASSDVYSVGLHKSAREILARISDALSLSNVFLTLTPVNTPLYDTLNARAIELAGKLGLPFLISRPVLYGRAEGADAAHEIMGAIASNTSIHKLWHKELHIRDFKPLTEAETLAEVKAMGERLIQKRRIDKDQVLCALRNGMEMTRRLPGLISYEWTKQPPSLPKMAEDEFKALYAECQKGWKTRFSRQVFGHLPGAEELSNSYVPRLKYELSVLQKLNFSGYFLLVQDVVRFAKSNGILVGPGRGSVGGSLVAYLMGITDCDPIRFDLLFERFINPDRLDLPDADLDFMSERRHEVVQYLTDKYGADRVAGVANFMALGTASSIRDVSRVLDMPEAEYRCSKYAPKEHGAIVPLAESAEKVSEIAAFRDKYEEVWAICLHLEGVMRNLGQHAAGIVVAGCDLTERAFIDRRKGGEGTVNWDKRIVEDQGLIKMDILGLSTLDLIDLTMKYIRQRHSKKVNLATVPLDDATVLELFAKGRTTGVFQFESGGMRRLLRELGKDGDISFEDITAATALYRPGPMESGMMDSYWKRKQGLEYVEYDHPLLEPILKPTFGVWVYQEQVMQTAVAICGYTAADADKLRKIMGKKLPEEMAKERGKFVAGAIKTVGCEEDWAERLFDKIEGFAGYGFNKSHSVEYALISYQSAYLKTYFPVEFYAAALTLMDDDKLPALLADAKIQGISVEPPDVNLSTGRFEILTDLRLSIPFSRVKGLSMRAAEAITTARGRAPFKSKEDFVERVNRRLINSAKVDALDRIGAFASIEPETPAATHPSRVRDQIELIPGLITEAAPIDRDMRMNDRFAVRQLKEMILEYREKLSEDGAPVIPAMNGKNRIMVVFDAPSTGKYSEESSGHMARGDGFAWQAASKSMGEVGFSIRDCYVTALLKRPKAGKVITADEIALYEPYLRQEIDLLKPPVIVALGSTALRWFLPDFKGKASEAAGKIVYLKEFDANLVVGFSPGEIWHDPDKQETLNEVFASAMRLTTI